ncbi:PPC domain-containing DNA-binding protein [Microbacterium rhizomatis]|uniref:PPC domain-containing DNA-binding protein n=1 Tax=Microbacterium rhizomatis TaxID=1631477 RepID=UPI001479365E|nr:DUF296 domain-containing protein [Microbacterium rhizomatis]
MREHLITTGRRLALAIEPGEEVLACIADACRRHGIEQAIITVFSGALRTATLIGTTRPPDDSEAPLGDTIDVVYTEGIGSGTVSYDAAAGYVVHLHVALGEKNAACRSVAGHMLSGTVHYVAEVVLDEVVSPRFGRESSVATSGVATLTFTDA